MSRSARRARVERPARLVAANTRPYARAASTSKESASHVAAAHCSLSCRRLRSVTSVVAWGPAASSASVTAAIADSSGSKFGSTTSWSTTTDVSRSPLVGSAMDGLVHYGIQVGAKSSRVNPRCPQRCVRDHCPGYESSGRDRSKLSHGHAVSSNDKRLPRLHLSEHCAGVVAQLSLGNCLTHGLIVAHVALCSKLRFYEECRVGPTSQCRSHSASRCMRAESGGQLRRARHVGNLARPAAGSTGGWCTSRPHPPPLPWRSSRFVIVLSLSVARKERAAWLISSRAERVSSE
jgi:hypothetical protein